MIKSARIAINGYQIEEPSNTIDFALRTLYIQKCQEAIFNNNSFAAISEYLFSEINQHNDNEQPWHAFVFGSEGGESMVKSRYYLRIRFDKLIVELFTAYYQSTEIVETSKSNQDTQTSQVNPTIQVPRANERVSTKQRRRSNIQSNPKNKYGNPDLKIQWFSRIRWFFNIPSKPEIEDSYGIHSLPESDDSDKSVKLLYYKPIFKT